MLIINQKSPYFLMKTTEPMTSTIKDVEKDDSAEVNDPDKFYPKPDAIEDKDEQTDLIIRDTVNCTWWKTIANNTDPVSLIEYDEYIYAGNRNVVYKINKLGSIETSVEINNSNKSIRFAIHSKYLIAGSDGKFIAIPWTSFAETNTHKKIFLKDANDIVSVVVDGDTIYAGSNGFAYKITDWYRSDGKSPNIKINNLPGKKFKEVRLSLTNQYLVVGTYGFVVLIDKNNFADGKKNKDLSLPSCEYEIVSVLVKNDVIYAGSNGYVYEITDYTGKPKIKKNSLTGRGKNYVEIDINEKHLVVGIHGYVVLVDLKNFEDEKKTKHISLLKCGYGKVSVKGIGKKSYAASNGYIYFDVEAANYPILKLPTDTFVNFTSDKYRNLFFASAGTVYSLISRKTLPMELIGQKTDQWCWAATAEMIMKYHGVNKNQCTQANDSFGRQDCCNSPTPVACIQPSHSDFQRYNFHQETIYCLYMQEIIDQIESNLPFAFSWQWNAGGGHQMIIAGYSSDFKMVLVYDPWPVDRGEKRWISYSSYVSGHDYSHNYDIINIWRKSKSLKVNILMEKSNGSMDDANQSEVTFDTENGAVCEGIKRYIELESLDDCIFTTEFGIPIQFISLKEVRDSQEINEIFNKPSEVNQLIYPVFNKLDGELIFSVVIKKNKNKDSWQIDSIGGTSLIEGLKHKDLEQLEPNQFLKLISIPSIYHHILISTKEEKFESIFLNIDLGLNKENKSNLFLNAIWSEIKRKADNTKYDF